LHIVAPNGRDRVAVLSHYKWLFPKRRDFASAEATKGLSDRPLETFGSPLPELTFVVAGEIALADANLSIIALLWGSPPR